MAEPRFDEVGVWTEIKLQILRDYLPAYSKILRKQSAIKHFAYIDGFAGAGTHISRRTGQQIPGSPTIALQQPFDHYHFVDLDGTRAELLRQVAGGRQDVTVYEGDCNEVLLQQVFPKCRFEDYRRALCLLDPYELNPKWEVVETAGKMRSIELFLNFSIMDANRNVLWTAPERVAPEQIRRMNAVCGGDWWRKVAYTTSQGLFGPIEEKARNEAIIGAYRRRIKELAGFKYVPDPFPIRNTKGAVLYYILFASHNATGDKIARAVFKKYHDRGAYDGREVQD